MKAARFFIASIASMFCCGIAAVSSGPALAQSSLTGSYFMIPHKHPDTGRGVDGRVTALVKKNLGPHGFPVATAIARSRTSGSGPITDVNKDGEILWWSTSGRGIKREKVQNDSLPMVFDMFYPDAYGNDATMYRAVHWRGRFAQPPDGSVTFTLESDDDAWLFIDGKLVVDNGGVKPPAEAPYTVAQLTGDTHVIDIFYLDRFPTRAVMHLQSNVDFMPERP